MINRIKNEILKYFPIEIRNMILFNDEINLVIVLFPLPCGPQKSATLGNVINPSSWVYPSLMGPKLRTRMRTLFMIVAAYQLHSFFEAYFTIFLFIRLSMFCIQMPIIICIIIVHIFHPFFFLIITLIHVKILIKMSRLCEQTTDTQVLV